MSNRQRSSPAELSPGWPEAASADAAADVARKFVVNLRAGIGTSSLRQLAREAGLDEKTLRKVLAGDSWPDLRTIALLEHALSLELYPRGEFGSAASVEQQGVVD